MSDLLEQQLRQRLHDVGTEVPAELDPPADLELRVARFRRRRRNQRRSHLLAIAAVLVIAVAIVSVAARTRTRRAVEVASSEKVSKVGRLRSNVAMLDARGRYVVALDSRGHQLATYVVTREGSEIPDVQVTSDHQTLWYLSRVEHGSSCGRVVRADIGTGESRIVENASEFAISRAGTQLAYRPCDQPTRTVIRDLATGAIESERAASRLVEFATDNELLRPSAVGDHPYAVGERAVYVINGARVQQLSGSGDTSLRTLVRVGDDWTLSQVVPTRAGVFVVGHRGNDRSALYRIVGNKLRLVRTYDYGQLTGVLARH